MVTGGTSKRAQNNHKSRLCNKITMSKVKPTLDLAGKALASAPPQFHPTGLSAERLQAQRHILGKAQKNRQACPESRARAGVGEPC